MSPEKARTETVLIINLHLYLILSIFVINVVGMKAIEIKSKTDAQGNLKIRYKLNKPGQDVRVLILVDDKESANDPENQYQKSLKSNPAFDFLSEPEEDIYSANDGEPLDD